jgi:hypothetical protein
MRAGPWEPRDLRESGDCGMNDCDEDERLERERIESYWARGCYAPGPPIPDYRALLAKMAGSPPPEPPKWPGPFRPVI